VMALPGRMETTWAGVVAEPRTAVGTRDAR